MICPNCAADLEPYSTPDIHTHWCEDCGCGYILCEDKDKWVSINEMEKWIKEKNDGKCII